MTYIGFDVSERDGRGRRLPRPSPSNAAGSPRARPHCSRRTTCLRAAVQREAGHAPGEWRLYIEETLRTMASLARRGLAFNALTVYSDPDRRRPDLYYADPLGRCSISASAPSPSVVALLHDYPLYEFTIHRATLTGCHGPTRNIRRRRHRATGALLLHARQRARVSRRSSSTARFERADEFCGLPLYASR